MLRNYIKTALRSLRANTTYSIINIAGLSVGMTVTILIGLWIWDEVTFDTGNTHYRRIAEVMQNGTMNGEINTWPTMPLPMAAELRKSYGTDFTSVVTASWNELHVLTATPPTPTTSPTPQTSSTKTASAQPTVISAAGTFFEPQAPDLLDLHMLAGTRDALKDPDAVILSSSLATTFFGNANPLNQAIYLDGKFPMKVTGVYADLPANSSFSDVQYMAARQFKLVTSPWMLHMQNPWGNNSFRVYAQVAPNADMNQVSARIKDSKLVNIRQDERKSNPVVFLHPMSKWHLYGDFHNGINTGGRIQFVWLFGAIGLFVLLLACINFMNLSTARSDRRAKEVGIRKAIGSLRSQLIAQFYSESFLTAFLAFFVAIGLVTLTLPLFNQIAAKTMRMPWTNPLFWLTGIGFTLFTGFVAGSYPALYLSSFQPVKVLKGSFKTGRFAAIPRRVLVILQFIVSVVLAIGTIVVFRQIRFAKDRPIGYNRGGLVSMFEMIDIHRHLEAIENELYHKNAIVSMAEAESPLTNNWSTNGGFDWRGKDPNLAVDFPNSSVTYDYGRTVGWQFAKGRDFSRTFATDSSSFIINEAAAEFMGFKDPIGQTIRWDGQPRTVIGVVRNVIAESPYAPVRPTLYYLDKNSDNFLLFRLNPAIATSEALDRIGSTIKKFSPLQPFNYKFADEEYAKKFGDEERTGQIATAFAILAIFVSCLGLFAMATFIAEQRVKEIGVRKVLGASIFNVWSLLSKEFIALIAVALLIAIPMSWYFMHGWLLNYTIHSTLPWWIFASTAAGAILITLVTISYQSIKAALTNPIRSLRTE